jgi:hypothetical protein
MMLRSHQPFNEICAERRLPRSTDSDVPHTDYGNSRLMHAEEGVIVEFVPKRHDTTVQA